MGLHNGMSYLGFQGICCSVLLHVAVHSLQGLARISPAGHSFWWFSFLVSDVTQSPFLSRKDLPVIFRNGRALGEVVMGELSTYDFCCYFHYLK